MATIFPHYQLYNKVLTLWLNLFYSDLFSAKFILHPAAETLKTEIFHTQPHHPRSELRSGQLLRESDHAGGNKRRQV